LQYLRKCHLPPYIKYAIIIKIAEAVVTKVFMGVFGNMAKAENQKPNIHAKHRERVRQKFLKVGLDGFSEHEIIEFVLFYALAQQDTNELAHRLIGTFGSVRGVLSASVDQLCQVKGVGERSAILLKLIGDIIVRDREKPDERPVLNTNEKIGDFVAQFYRANNVEMVIVVALDHNLRVIRTIKVAEGDIDNVSIPVAKTVRSLVTCGAAAAVLAHNHPSQVALPSEEDVRATKKLRNSLATVGIELLEHIIVTPGDYISFRDSGNNIYVVSRQ